MPRAIPVAGFGTARDPTTMRVYFCNNGNGAGVSHLERFDRRCKSSVLSISLRLSGLFIIDSRSDRLIDKVADAGELLVRPALFVLQAVHIVLYPNDTTKVV